MATYRCVGRGVTDSNGVAHLTHDCSGNPLQSSGYVGSGKGQTQIIASLDTPSQINDGSLQSETYEVLDCYRYDSGTDPNNNIWSIGYGTLTRGTEYSTLKESATNDGIIAISSIPLTDYHLEVDIMQVDGTTNRNVLQILNDDYTPVTDGYRNGALGEWKHFDIDFTNLSVNTRVRIVTGSDCTEIRFKNFKLYPI